MWAKGAIGGLVWQGVKGVLREVNDHGVTGMAMDGVLDGVY